MHEEIILKCILCHVHPILGNDGEETRQHARQWPKSTTKELCFLRRPKSNSELQQRNSVLCAVCAEPI
jgi:hypothetical protein